MLETAIKPSSAIVDYGRQLEKEIRALETEVTCYPAIAAQYPARWLAIKLLEQDSDLQTKLLQSEGGPALLTKAQLSYARLEESYGEDIDVIIADRRYSYIHHIVSQVMSSSGEQLTLTDKIDRFVTHRVLGVVIFLAVMWVVFKLTADVSVPMINWIEGIISGPVTGWTAALLAVAGLGGTWFESLILDGVIAGVGGVLVFVPVLMLLYIALAILEDSGYMARAAFVMDGLMARIGLQGKSFLPMMVGFGCTVPAIYATRTLENEKDRILTGLLVPFMSCGARLPVYVLFAAVFFPRHAGTAVFAMYMLGILTALVLGLILRRTLFKDKESTALLMELPPYHRPNLRTIWTHTWERTWSFIQGAWTIILAVSLVLWFLMAVPVGADSGTFADTDVDQSLFATAAGAVAPLLDPLGFGTWEASGSLITGFMAKEVVVSTMAQVYGVEEATDKMAEPTTAFQDAGRIITSLWDAIIATLKEIPSIIGINFDGDDAAQVPGDLQLAVYRSFEESSGGHAALAGLAFMVFVLIYTPCMVAAAAARQEFGRTWMWRSVLGQLVLAWLMALVVFQGGKLLFG